MTLNGMAGNLNANERAEIAAAMGRGRRMMPDLPPDLMLNALVTARFDAMGLPLERAEELAAAEISAMRRRAAADALALAGRRGDRAVGHLTPGEMVVPKALLDRDPALKRTIIAALGAAGLDWRRYEVGGADDSINPATGLREFNFEGDGSPSDPGFSELNADLGSGSASGGDDTLGGGDDGDDDTLGGGDDGGDEGAQGGLGSGGEPGDDGRGNGGASGADAGGGLDDFDVGFDITGDPGPRGGKDTLGGGGGTLGGAAGTLGGTPGNDIDRRAVGYEGDPADLVGNVPNTAIGTGPGTVARDSGSRRSTIGGTRNQSTGNSPLNARNPEVGAHHADLARYAGDTSAIDNLADWLKEGIEYNVWGVPILQTKRVDIRPNPTKKFGPRAPGGARTLSPQWRERIAGKEIKGRPHGGYGTTATKVTWDEKTNKLSATITLGRYQMTRTALKDAGYLDAKNQWTKKDGIESKADFLNHPKAQEAAIDAVMSRAGEQLVSNRAIGRLGQRFRGVRRDITVTPAGIYAAAHRRGAKAVAEYFDWLEKNNFDSRKGIPGNKNLEKTFRQIETRLREFEDLQLWSGD